MSRITELNIRDFKKISTINIKPTGNVTTISGANESGKTSTLDAISVLLQGKAAKIPVPVRRGAKKAIIAGKIQADSWDAFDGVLKVERHISAKGTWSIKVTSNDHPQKSPETMLKQIFPHTLDPVGFQKLSASERIQLMKQITGLDFTKLDKRRQQTYEERTEINAAKKSYRAQIDGITVFPDAPLQRVSVSELTTELRIRQEINRKAIQHEDEIREVNKDIETLDRQIAAIENSLARLRTEKTKKKQQGDSLTKLEVVRANEEEILEQIASADQVNKRVECNQQVEALQRKVEDMHRKSEYLTDVIGKIDEDKATQIENVNLPIDGLSFSENDIYYRGLPFDSKQLSAEEILTVSFAIAIAAQPNLKDILIHNGNDLDKKHLQVVERIAGKHGIHVWLERIEGGKGSILIEDGKIADMEQEIEGI